MTRTSQLAINHYKELLELLGVLAIPYPNVEMVSLHHISLCNKQPLSLPQLSLTTNNNKPVPVRSLWFILGDANLFKRTDTNQSCSSWTVRAVKKDSQHYEIDPDKAREALQKLDQQLQDLSKKQVAPAKIKVSDVKITRDVTTEEEEVPEFSGSVLTLVTAGLFLFTIFYNILYITVIDPPVKEPAEPTSLDNESPKLAILQMLRLAPEVFN